MKHFYIYRNHVSLKSSFIYLCKRNSCICLLTNKQSIFIDEFVFWDIYLSFTTIFFDGVRVGRGEGVKGGAYFQCFKNNVLKPYTGNDLEFSSDEKASDED